MVVEDERAAVEALIRRLERAWNAMDPEAVAAGFAEDADFVDLAGEHHQGRAAIVAGHRALFRDYYADGAARMSVRSARPLAPGVLLVHLSIELDAPRGPLAGRNTSVSSMVLVRRPEVASGGWEIAAFHDTRRMARGRKPAADKDLDA